MVELFGQALPSGPEVSMCGERKTRGARLVGLSLMLAVSLTLASAAASADQASILEHPVIGEIVSMIEADVGQEVIVARILQMEAVPTLTGEEIAALKRRGVTDVVLLALVRAATPGSPRLGAPAAESTADRAVASSAIRVMIAPSFPVTHYEVSVDDLTVATRGTLFVGESEPGRILKRPQRFSLEESVVAFEGKITPGEHSVLVGFAVTRVDEDPTVKLDGVQPAKIHHLWCSRRGGSGTGTRLECQYGRALLSRIGSGLCRNGAVRKEGAIQIRRLAGLLGDLPGGRRHRCGHKRETARTTMK